VADIFNRRPALGLSQGKAICSSENRFRFMAFVLHEVQNARKIAFSVDQFAASGSELRPNPTAQRE
jgi:hypothetical protein